MLDRVEIKVEAGNGGNGAVSFRREKFVPFGGPDGGDGGRGGDVVIQAVAGLSTLQTFKHRRIFRAESGGNGSGQKKYGKSGAPLSISVPPGTVVFEKTASGNIILADLVQAGQNVVVARGGKGGLGNVHFVSSTQQAPRIAQKGVAGEEKDLLLELRLIADVGIIGLPNVGKSSLLAAVSAAHPEVADYPFTTKEPVLGVVETGGESFVLAEIPGLIEDAHTGKGLGHDFLRHAMRTRMFIHLVDGSYASPLEDMKQVNKEIRLFDPDMAGKPQVVAVNKIDLPEVRERLPDLASIFRRAGLEVRFVSAATREGTAELMKEVLRVLKETKPASREAEAPLKVFRPRPVDVKVKVYREGEVFIVAAPEVERILDNIDLDDPDARRQLDSELAARGVTRALEKAGVKRGDTVKIGIHELEWD